MPRALAAITFIAVIAWLAWWSSASITDSAPQVEQSGGSATPLSIENDSGLIAPDAMGARTAEGREDTDAPPAKSGAPEGGASSTHPSARFARHVTGRLLHPDGAPFASRSIHFGLCVDGGTPGADGGPKTGSSWTASDGRFNLVLRGVKRADLSHTLTIVEDKLQRFGLSVTAWVPSFGGKQTVDLGDLRLMNQPQGVLARFVLIDGLEQRPISISSSVFSPARGVALFSHRTGQQIGRAAFDRASGGYRLLFSNGESLGWIVLPRHGVRVDSIDHRLFLDVRNQAVTAVAIDDEPGVLVRAGESVTIRLARGGTIEGRVASPAHLDSSVRIVARRRAKEGTAGPAWQDPVDERGVETFRVLGVGESPLAMCRPSSSDGTFRMLDVPPGVVSIQVEIDGKVVAVVSDVSVRNAEVTKDLRLGGLIVDATRESQAPR